MNSLYYYPGQVAPVTNAPQGPVSAGISHCVREDGLSEIVPAIFEYNPNVIAIRQEITRASYSVSDGQIQSNEARENAPLAYLLTSLYSAENEDDDSDSEDSVISVDSEMSEASTDSEIAHAFDEMSFSDQE